MDEASACSKDLGPVVQSTISLVVSGQNVNCSSKYNM